MPPSVAPPPSDRVVHFYRSYQRFQGGHLKVGDYFRHVTKAAGVTAELFLTTGTVWDADNPWWPFKKEARPFPPSNRPDVRFLAGLDWYLLDDIPAADRDLPTLNLIQGVRHANPRDERYPFLRNRAVRICVSEEVGAAVSATGVVNGPIIVIPNGLDYGELPEARAFAEREIDLFIDGCKQPNGTATPIIGMAEELGLNVYSITSRVGRCEYLDLLNRAKTALLLPRRAEGFFLPALEAMALETLVICPDCIGNRSFCLDGINCFRPPYEVDALRDALQRAESLNPQERTSMIEQAKNTAAIHDILVERRRFHEILANLDLIW